MSLPAFTKRLQEPTTSICHGSLPLWSRLFAASSCGSLDFTDSAEESEAANTTTHASLCGTFGDALTLRCPLCTLSYFALSAFGSFLSWVRGRAPDDRVTLRSFSKRIQGANDQSVVLLESTEEVALRNEPPSCVHDSPCVKLKETIVLGSTAHKAVNSVPDDKENSSWSKNSE